jgi:hypothetical protein
MPSVAFFFSDVPAGIRFSPPSALFRFRRRRIAILIYVECK